MDDVLQSDSDLDSIDKEQRSEHYWNDVFALKSVANTNRYTILPCVIKSGLVLAQMNAESERSLSINARVVTKERCALGDTTICGLRAVKDAVRFYDPVGTQPEKIPVTKAMCSICTCEISSKIRTGEDWGSRKTWTGKAKVWWRRQAEEGERTDGWEETNFDTWLGNLEHTRKGGNWCYKSSGWTVEWCYTEIACCHQWTIDESAKCKSCTYYIRCCKDQTSRSNATIAENQWETEGAGKQKNEAVREGNPIPRSYKNKGWSQWKQWEWCSKKEGQKITFLQLYH